MTNIAVGYNALNRSIKWVVISSICCFNSNTYAYRLISENGVIAVNTSIYFPERKMYFVSDVAAQIAVKYYYDNFDKWKLFYMALSERDDAFRDVFLNMVKYYCAF
jgi:hypothetical protein